MRRTGSASSWPVAARVVVLGPGTLPKTPSGKLRRAATGQLLAEPVRLTPPGPPR